MDENLLKLDARLGALELLIRNLYAHRFASQDDPLASAEQAARSIERLSKQIKVSGPEPVVNDLLAAEAEEFLVAMFHEIVEIVRETIAPAQAADVEPASQPDRGDKAPEWWMSPEPSHKLRRTG